MIREAIRIVAEKLFESGVYISLKLSTESYELFKEYIKVNIPDVDPTPHPHT